MTINEQKMRLFLVSLIGVLVAVWLFNAIYKNWALEEKRLDDLSQAKIFSIGYIGFIPHLSESEILFRELMLLDTPAENFQKIINSKESTLEAKMYAACGLWELSRPLFLKEAEKLKSKDLYASVMYIDILTKESVDSILNNIEKNGCRLY